MVLFGFPNKPRSSSEYLALANPCIVNRHDCFVRKTEHKLRLAMNLAVKVNSDSIVDDFVVMCPSMAAFPAQGIPMEAAS
jgi:hypothetical protein